MLAQQAVVDAELDTELLDRLVVDYQAPQPVPEALALAGLARIGTRDRGDVWQSSVGWRIGGRAPVVTRLVSGTDHFTVSVRVDVADEDTLTGEVMVETEAETPVQWRAAVEYRTGRLVVDGVSQSWTSALVGDTWWVAGPHGTWQLALARPILDEAAADNAGEILSPMPGTVVAVGIEDGAEVTAGTAVVVVEAMKMEHALTAPIDGTVALTVKVGDKVSAGQALAHVQADPAQAAQEN